MSMESIFGVSEKRPQVTGPQEGVITKHAPDGGVLFKVPSYSSTIEFGPAKWARSQIEPGGADSHDHAETLPPIGSTCLVVFVGPGIQRPWVVCWW